MDNFNEEVGYRIYKARAEKGITLKELGDLIGIAESTVQRYEKGKIKSLDIEMIKKLSKALNVSPAYLMGWDKDEYLIISKELQMTKEVIKILSDFPLIMNIDTGSTMMDIFNNMVSNPKFKSVIKKILMYSSRTEDDWEKMITHFPKNTNIDKNYVKTLFLIEIMKFFEDIVDDIINSEIETYNKVTKDKDGSLKIEMRDENKVVFDNSLKELKTPATSINKKALEFPKEDDNSHLTLNAAHEIEGASEEDKQHDDDIMDDDNF
jgi:transcriptional regulator with XRE-family HTH domain